MAQIWSSNRFAVRFLLVTQTNKAEQHVGVHEDDGGITSSSGKLEKGC